MSEVWFDTREGKLAIGRDAAGPLIDEAGPQVVVPLVDLITDPDFPFHTGDFEMDQKRWEQDTCVALGKWVLGLLDSASQVPRLTEPIIERLHILGLFPVSRTLRQK